MPVQHRILLATLLCGLLPSLAAMDAPEEFLTRHWSRPLLTQGSAPPQFTPLEASLAPDACGTCHPQQFADWQQSLHSRAMGPGVLGQLLELAPEAHDERQACLRCHAPLREQADDLVAELESGRTDGLHRQGLVCAGCHVRGYRWYGPPRKDDGGEAAAGPHGGFRADTAFEDSLFCAACHQFDVDGYALNGKLLENTYAEWAASRYARNGTSCQSCHMPERRHRWRGIHDPQMVRQGVEISTAPPRLEGDDVIVRLTLRNTAVGHRFPTYVTPRVVMAAWQEDAQGNPLPETRQERPVARQVTPDLSRELADTRLAPDEKAVLSYRMPRHLRATRLVLSVHVEPDAFYMQMYRALLAQSGAGRGAPSIRHALEASQASAFDLHFVRYPLVSP